MNCDQAFDCLTDPGRRHSPQLEEHLAHCERCRQMQDTLEPALDLFDELVPEPDLSRAGRATAMIAPESVRIAEQASARLRASGTQSPIERRGTVVRYAAAAMVGALLMGLTGAMNNAVAPVESTSACLYQSRAIDPQAYPTSNTVVRRCNDCHQVLNPTPIDVEAQPISIEAPADVAETADLIVRVLSLRGDGRIVLAVQHAPRGGLARWA